MRAARHGALARPGPARLEGRPRRARPRRRQVGERLARRRRAPRRARASNSRRARSREPPLVYVRARLMGRRLAQPCPLAPSSLAPSGASTTPGSRCPTAPGWPRASGCPRTPRATPCRRSSSTCPTARATRSPMRDSRHHPYFAGHGYAGVRVDLRGSGDSDGILLDEYLPQEQDDALEVIAWLAAQPWCTRRGRHVRDLLGRLQRPAGRGPAPAGAEGRDLDVRERRPLLRRRPLRGRLRARRGHAAVGGHDAHPDAPCRPTRPRSATAGARPGSRRMERDARR